MSNRFTILLVSPPGDLQIGLQALLSTHLAAEVLAVGSASAIFNVIEKQKPDLVILDQDTHQGDAPTAVKDATTRWESIHFIVLVNEDAGHEEFKDTGADRILIKGTPGSKLIDEIKELVAKE